MRKVIDQVIYMVLICCCMSCKHKMHTAEYVQYINNKQNGLKNISSIDGWEFCLQYKPYDYIVLTENKEAISESDFEKRKSEMVGTAWFSISIKRVDNSISPLRYGITSSDEYNMRLNYFLNEASKDIKLVYNNVSLKPVNYLFENSYNLMPQETMIIGFYLPKGENAPVKDMKLSFNDRIFKTGIINASFSEKDLNNIPQLIY